MTVAGTNLIQSYAAEPGSVPLARRALTEFAANAGASIERVADIRLAVSEALTNVVVHGYRDGPGQIHVTAAAVGDELWILISDDGCGLRVRADRPGLGVGLALIARTSDEFTIVPRSGGGTEIRMRFSLAPCVLSVAAHAHTRDARTHPRGVASVSRHSARF